MARGDSNFTNVVASGTVSSSGAISTTQSVGGPSFIFSGLTGNTVTMRSYQATVTVASGATTGKEAAIGMPANFIPLAVAVHCTVAATNACALVDIGDDADTDSYCDGIVVNNLTTTGFKGIFGCQGVRGLSGAAVGTGGGTGTADEVEIVVSADPGATGVTVRLTFIGFVAT